jgi:tetratricopeptide (TPR) repeat protein
VARYFSALAAEQLGDFDRAIEEYRYSVRTDASATEARLRLARLYAASGEYEEAAHVIRHEADDGAAAQSRDEALYELELLARIGRARQLPPRLLEAIKPLEVWPQALAAMARGVRANRGPAASARLVREADRLDLDDPANAAALWSLTEDRLAMGQRAEALARIDAALRAHPDASAFHALKAFVIERGGEDEAAAKAAWKRAIELDAKNARALRGLAAREAAAGRVDEALDLYARAAEADAEDTDALRASAALLVAAGRGADAEAALVDLLGRDPYDGAASLELARLMLDRGVAPSDAEVASNLRRAARFGHAAEAEPLIQSAARAPGAP